MAKKKSAQKLTVFDGLGTTEEVADYLEKNPKKYSQLKKYYHTKFHESYSEKNGLEYKYTKLIIACYEFNANDFETEKFRNITYEGNHSIISRCIHNYIVNNRCFPHIGTISHETKLSRTTIYKHLNDGLYSKDSGMVRGKIEYMVSSALSNLYLIGVEDRNANALKAFIELSGAVIKRPGTVNNYIQINNLKITREQFEQLPEDVILEVEQVISKSFKR